MNIESIWDIVALIFGIVFLIPLIGLIVGCAIYLFHFLLNELVKKGDAYILEKNGGSHTSSRSPLGFWVGYGIAFITGSAYLAIGYVLVN